MEGIKMNRDVRDEGNIGTIMGFLKGVRLQNMYVVKLRIKCT